MKPFIQLDHVSYTYPGRDQPALDDLNLTLMEGECVALVGANGSGKTTLARHLNALLIPTAGRVMVAGKSTSDRAYRDAIHTMVGMVFQNPADQVVTTIVEEDVAFGPENLGLPPAEIRTRVDEALEAVGLSKLRTRPPHFLSAGQMQRLALAGVLAMRPRCVVFDEATSMLDPAGRRMVNDWMALLRAQGLTVVYITHYMSEAAFADRVIVLDSGRVVLDGSPHQIFCERDRLEALGLELPPALRLAESIAPLVGGLPGGLLTGDALLAALAGCDGAGLVSRGVSPRPVDESVPLIEVDNLSHVYLAGTPFAAQALNDANLVVRAREPHGLLGATGAGKSTLLQHLNGLLRPQSGRVTVLDQDLRDQAVDIRDIRRRVGLVFQNPELQFFEQYVGDEIAFGPRQSGAKTGLAERVRQAMALVGLDFSAYKDRLTFTLSGGERRKVALASTLALEPEILLLDEPTAGLDPVSRREVMATLNRLQREGVSLVLSSHNMDDLAAMTRRLTVFQNGSDLFGGPTGEVFGEVDRLKAAGLEPPLAAKAAAVLKSKGWPLPVGIATPDELVSGLERCRRE